MAKNRTETKSEINLIFQPVLEIADHRTYLNDQADNLKFRKDVIQTQTVVSGSETIDFAGKDTYVINASTYGSTVNFTPLNLDNGDEKFVIINKNVGQSVNFSGITDLTEYPARTTALTTLLYRFIQKNGVNYAELLSNTVAQYTWQPLTFVNNWSGLVQARIDEFGFLQLQCSSLGCSTFTSRIFATLPTALIPFFKLFFPIVLRDVITDVHRIAVLKINTNGELSIVENVGDVPFKNTDLTNFAVSSKTL